MEDCPNSIANTHLSQWTLCNRSLVVCAKYYKYLQPFFLSCEVSFTWYTFQFLTHQQYTYFIWQILTYHLDTGPWYSPQKNNVSQTLQAFSVPSMCIYFAVFCLKSIFSSIILVATWGKKTLLKTFFPQIKHEQDLWSKQLFYKSSIKIFGTEQIVLTCKG